MVAVAELAGVSVRRGTALLLHDVNFKVEEGDRWVIIGPNGAGKTTLLALLSTQMHPTTGVVEVLGEPGEVLLGPDEAESHDADPKFGHDVSSVVRLMIVRIVSDLSICTHYAHVKPE